MAENGGIAGVASGALEQLLETLIAAEVGNESTSEAAGSAAAPVGRIMRRQVQAGAETAATQLTSTPAKRRRRGTPGAVLREGTAQAGVAPAAANAVDAIAAELGRPARQTAVVSLREAPEVAAFRQELTGGLIRVDTANQLLRLIDEVVRRWVL